MGKAVEKPVSEPVQKPIHATKHRDAFAFIEYYITWQSVAVVLKWNKAFPSIPLFPVKRSHEFSVVEADDGMVAGSHEASPFLSSTS